MKITRVKQDDLVSIQMTMKQASVLREISEFEVSVPKAIAANGGETHWMREALEDLRDNLRQAQVPLMKED